MKHFSTVLDHGPAIIYNVPDRTVQDIHINLMNNLSSHPNFAGIKNVCEKIVFNITLIKEL